MIYKYIYYLVKNTIITEQHGFFQNRSLESNLLVYSEFLHNNLDGRTQVDAVYTDFSKAFDKVDHNILLLRLAEVGVGGTLLRWISSYIKNRSQFVASQGFKSADYISTSGVPQGSHLGPLLFIIYINNIKSCFHHSKFLLYADDMKIFLNIKSVADCVHLQEDLNRLVMFCNENGLYFNLEKCCCITFTRNLNSIDYAYQLDGENLKRVNFIKDLGIIFDSKLIFDRHVDSVVNASSKMLGYIKRKCSSFSNHKALITIYNAFVLSKLSFGSVIWCPFYKTYISRLENVQNKFVRFLCFKTGYLASDGYLSAALTHFNIISLENRMVMSDVLVIYKLLNNIIQNADLLSMVYFNIPQTNLRNFELFNIPFRKTNCSLNSPLCRSLRHCNRLSTVFDVFSINLVQLKKVLKQQFRNRP